MSRIHSVYAIVNRRFRATRMKRFRETIAASERTRILDVGGTPSFWESERDLHVTILNLEVAPERLPPRIEYVQGDGTNLPFADGSFDIMFSNSVIEHLGTWNAQQRFAAEIRRCGRAVWVQTPNRLFPIEPHYLTPLIHWFPKRAQRLLLRNFSIWGWITRPSRAYVDRVVEEIRLLTYGEMCELFPDCAILRERVLGLTKSFVAARVRAELDDG